MDSKKLFSVVVDYYYGSAGIPGTSFYNIRAGSERAARDYISDLYKNDKYRGVRVSVRESRIIELNY